MERAMGTNVIKLQFLRNGEPTGRAYSYFTPEPVQPGDIVDIEVTGPEKKSQGMVVEINVPYEEIEPFKDRAKTIIGKAKQKEGEAQ